MSIPEHLLQTSKAVALNYDGVTVPKLSAKGEDDLAQAIIDIAIAHKVPVYENAELVQWLGQMEVGDDIPEQLYQVIAEILSFVYRLEDRLPGQARTKES
ncbi:MAG: flagellar protein FhlB [Pseudomonas sp.]|nr:flagellar protein FhlB [Pseudomonas sp.]